MIRFDRRRWAYGALFVFSLIQGAVFAASLVAPQPEAVTFVEISRVAVTRARLWEWTLLPYATLAVLPWYVYALWLTRDRLLRGLLVAAMAGTVACMALMMTEIEHVFPEGAGLLGPAAALKRLSVSRWATFLCAMLTLGLSRLVQTAEAEG